MSHEIRTPMNAIMGLVNIAKTTSSQVKRLDLLDKVSNASENLLGIIKRYFGFFQN